MTEGNPELEWSPEEAQLLRSALLELEPAACDCPGREDDVRQFLASPADIDPEFRDHLLNCFACWSTLQGELAEREFGEEAVDRLDRDVFQRVKPPGRVALDHPQPLSNPSPLIESILAHPPFGLAPAPREITELQGDTLRELDQAFATRSIVTLDAAAGSGKTCLLAHWLRKLPGQKVLWMVPHSLMIPQVMSALKGADVTVASLGPDPVPEGEFDLLIVESDTRPSKINAKRTLLVTPAPSDKSAPVIESLSLSRLIDSGLWKSPRHDAIDTGQAFCLRKDALSADFSPQSLRLLDNLDRNRLIADRVLELPARSVVMAVDDPHARALVLELKERAPSLRTAVALGRTDLAERERMAKDLSSGILSMVIDSAPLLESPACRNLEAVVLARPTLRPELYARMVSRAWPALAARRSVRIVEIRDRLTGFRGAVADLHSIGISPRD